ncbi:MAG: hypothetical protein C0617_03050 [Desulfuromonas sp.]|uniref:hypothetical protein n=1 Tax=Desulfuromonas sp. TaxID=892 RepID=UPI000CBC1DC8|nr:hypothetical protein [Desulfuromonas sp.]PLX85676.1 MAG: hypothetical protein C0617_03050 [Desulfuromonas sp.]
MTENNQPTEEHQGEKHPGKIETWWDATLKTWNATTFRAGQYKRLVQKKIDLASLQKQIAADHAELGRQIDQLRDAGEADIFGNQNVQGLFEKLHGLKENAATHEREIADLQTDHTPETMASSEEQPPEETRH